MNKDFDGMYFMPNYEESFGALLGIYAVYCLVVIAITLGAYVLQSVGMYSIARRRGISKAWLAWLPLGDLWILGSISDQYQYVVHGRVRNKRKALVVLNVICWLLYCAVFVVLLIAVNQMVVNGRTGQAMLTLTYGMLFVCIMGCVGIVLTVIEYIALYDLYRSAEPSDATVYLIVSILLNIAQPVVIFLCRNKDGGMPPRIDGR